MLEGEVDKAGHQRVCLYLLSCVPYVAGKLAVHALSSRQPNRACLLAEPEDSILLKTCLALYKKHNSWPQAMQVRSCPAMLENTPRFTAARNGACLAPHAACGTDVAEDQ